MALAAVSVAGRGRGEATAGDLDLRRLVVGFLLIAGAMCALFLVLPAGVALLVAIPLVSVWVWRMPVRGVYLLVAGAALIEVFPLGFPDSLTDRIPLFLNLNNSAGFEFPITPAEILMLVTGVAAVTRDAVDRRLQWPRGRLFNAYVAYVLIVIGAEIHGLVSNGDFKLSLWEIRPQVYGFIMFVLAATLVENREQLKRLGLVLLLAIFAKAVIGGFRYFVTVHGDLGSQLEVLAHEDSYFLSMFITAAFAGLIWIRNRRFVILMSLGSVVATVTILANSRRAGVFAAAGAIGVVVLLAYAFEPSLRKRIAMLCVIGVIAGAGFLTYAWNKEFGIQAQLVRPVRSLVDPSSRDLSSDLYRTAETTNILVTYRTSPIIGVGFGSPFLMIYPIADISDIYPLWNVIPHNSLLWVGMRMGALGFIAFWGLIGIAVLEGFDVMRKQRDPLVRAIAAFALAAVAAEIAVAYGDLQLENFRNLIFLGAVLGVLSRLPRLAETADV